MRTSSATKPVARRRRPETFTVSFRVGPAQRKVLEERAAAWGVSVHECARNLLLETLEDAERARVRDEVKGVDRQVGRLREDIAATLEMLLLNLTPANEEDVRRWVSENLRGR